MPNPFDYEDIVEFLHDSYSEIKSQRPRYSLRAWSIKLGFRSPASLSRILTRNRRATLAQVRLISKSLGLSAEDALYLETISQYDPAQVSAVLPEIRKIFNKRQKIEKLKVSLDSFESISDWIYPAILEALCLKRKFVSPEDFLPLFSTKNIDAEKIDSALKKLMDLSLIEMIDGLYRRTDNRVRMLEPEATSVALRQFHTEMLGQAQKATVELAREKRDIRGFMFAVKKENYEKVQGILMNAYNEISTLAEDNEGDHVYHLSTAFFPVSN